MPLVAREGPNDKRGVDGCAIAPGRSPCALSDSRRRDTRPSTGGRAHRAAQAGIRR
jgi:hypothetical protein